MHTPKERFVDVVDFGFVVFQEREKREREQAKIQAVEDEKKAAKDEEDRLRAIAKVAKAGREAHKKEMRRRKKVRTRVFCVV